MNWLIVQFNAERVSTPYHTEIDIIAKFFQNCSHSALIHSEVFLNLGRKGRGKFEDLDTEFSEKYGIISSLDFFIEHSYSALSASPPPPDLLFKYYEKERPTKFGNEGTKLWYEFGP